MTVPAAEKGFFTAIEVVPPAGPDPGPLLASLKALAHLAVDAFSVATNPVANPRMSAMALCALIQRHTGRNTVLHCTTRDHNRLSLQGLVWGARALGIGTVLVTTGDFVARERFAGACIMPPFDRYDVMTAILEEGDGLVGRLSKPHEPAPSL